MEKKWTVYCHQNKINGKKYIGITCCSIKTRWGTNGSRYAFYFGNAIQKYGWDNFEHFILYRDVSKDFAITLEKLLIEAFNTQDTQFGYNLTAGGEGALTPSQSTRNKLSAIRKGHIVTEETRRKLSESNKGKHSHSAETRAKISASHKHRVVSDETRAKLSMSNKSRLPEVRAKISASNIGKHGYNKGKKYTEEEKERLYASRRGRHWKMSEESKLKISMSHKGKKLSEEHKAKLFAGQRRYINKMQAQKEVAPNE